jgi:hypothetical protein
MKTDFNTRRNKSRGSARRWETTELNMRNSSQINTIFGRTRQDRRPGHAGVATSLDAAPSASAHTGINKESGS